MASSPTVAWTEHVHAALARAGLKRGGARERVIELLADQPCALSAVQIEDALRERATPTGRASIYRVLELLSEHGLVSRVEVGQGQALFERVAPDGEHHHHLLCEECGRLVAFDDPGLERAIDSLSERLGVRVEHHDVVLRGACQRCD
jgi:Fur family ferric uptake transcriptional regulator